VKLNEKEILKQVVSVIKSHLPQAQIIIFGSRAVGDASLTSDFDIAIDTGKRIKPSTIFKIKEDIEEKIRTLYSFDIVDLNAVDSSFKEVILKTGKKIG